MLGMQCGGEGAGVAGSCSSPRGAAALASRLRNERGFKAALFVIRSLFLRKSLTKMNLRSWYPQNRYPPPPPTCAPPPKFSSLFLRAFISDDRALPLSSSLLAPSRRELLNFNREKEAFSLFLYLLSQSDSPPGININYDVLSKFDRRSHYVTLRSLGYSTSH